MADYLNIAGRVRTTASDGVAIEAQEVKDLNLDKSQQEINADVQTELGNRYTKEETYNREEIEELVDPTNYVSVVATNLTTDVTDLLPAEGATDTIYRIGNWNGTQYDPTMYALFAWNGSAYVCLAVRSFVGEVYDISVNHPDGQGNPTPYADLAAALGTNGANVPADIRRGGMSIKFVQSSDHKYVQYRLMSDSFNTTPANWQGIDDEPTAGSRNLVESGGIYNALEPYSEITKIENGDIDDSESIKVVNNDNTETILEISNDGVNAKNLKSNGDDVLTGQDVNDIYTKEDIYVAVQEQSWVSDDYDANGNGEEFAKINGQGIYAKNFHKLDGSPVGYEILNGKKWAVLGDSFSKGDNIGTLTDGKYAGENKSYPYLIGNRTGINVLKFFENGRTLAFPAEPGTFTNSVTNPTQTFYYQNIPADVDYITIYLGINDSHHAQGSSGGDGEDNTGVIPIGTISDSTTATYYGAWNVVLTWLLENRPFAHIGIIVSNGCETVDYRTAQIAIARKYGIPFIDLNGDDRTPFMLRSKNPDIPNNIKNIRIQQQAIDPSSNTHPNANAHLFESYFIENFLRTI